MDLGGFGDVNGLVLVWESNLSEISRDEREGSSGVAFICAG